MEEKESMNIKLLKENLNTFKYISSREHNMSSKMFSQTRNRGWKMYNNQKR